MFDISQKEPESFNTKALRHTRHMQFFYSLTSRSLLSFAVVAIAAVGITLWAVKSSENHTLVLASFSKSIDANNFTVVTGGKWIVKSPFYELNDPVIPSNGDDSGMGIIVGNANITTYNSPLPDQNWTLTTRIRGTNVGHPFTGFSVLFGYVDPSNYYFVNFNDTATATTNGVFQVKAGVETKLTDFASTIKMDRFYDVELDRVGQNVAVINDGTRVANVTVPGLSIGRMGFGSISNGVDVVRVEVTSSTPVPSPTPPPSPSPQPPSSPIYSCDSLTAQQVASSQAYAFSVNTTAKNGPTVDSYMYNFGDGSPTVTSNQNSIQHTYSNPGNFMASVAVKFNVNGQIVVTNSQSCVVGVSVSQPIPTPTPPPGSSGGSLDAFFAPAFTGTPFCHFSNQNVSINNGVLTVNYPAGSSAPSAGAPFGGAQACIPASTGPLNSMQLTYAVRFPVGFQFVKGGKLPGLYGGIEPFSGGSHNANGWSMRLMWRTGGAGEVYSYTANTTGYGDEYGKGNFTFQADGQWHTLTERITINTPNTSNGSVTLAYDGRQVIDQTGIDITNTNTQIGGLFFSTFYGGHDSTWAPTSDQHIDFANFSVSR